MSFNGNMHSPCVMTNTDQFFVRLCGCGVVHLSFGATTLNLSEEAVIAVTETLRELAPELRRRVNNKNATQKVGTLILGKFPSASGEE